MLEPKDLTKLLDLYHTSMDGLSGEEILKRRKIHSFNEIKATGRKSLLLMFLEEFKDLMVIILIVAAILALIAGEDRDAYIILFIVVLNAAIGFIQKFKAEKAIEALKKMMTPRARVIREGRQQEILARELVPGDILVLEEGDAIPADAVLFEANELETQESALTGESTPVQKLTYDIAETASTEAEKENMVFMGTQITHGNGRAVVAYTGMGTQMGKIARLTTQTKKDLSPLEKELLRIGLFVGKVSLVISGILLAVGVFIQGKQFVDTLLFATSVAVAAVPEGLPATVTIALAIGVQRLAKKNAIVKQLSSVETLGSTTVICSDKTGTLTENQMTVKEVYLDQFEISVRGVGYNPHGSVHIEHNKQPCVTIGAEKSMYEDYEHHRKELLSLKKTNAQLFEALEIFMIGASVCNNAELAQEDAGWKILGDPTEGALLTLAEKSGFNLKNLRAEYAKVTEISFDSTRKRMSVIVKDPHGKLFAFVKGAPDSILSMCDHLLTGGRVMRMDKDSSHKFQALNEDMAGRALRVLGFAYREITAEEAASPKKEDIEKNLTFLGLAGMIDPPRPEVKEAVIMAHRAGIRTYIITGDHGLTAEAIAKQVNLVGKSGRPHHVFTGEDIGKMKDHELKTHLSNKDIDIIFARVSPEHKLRIVQLLKENGEIVAVTGDGVNDAPALKRADIGIAMGIAGTDVSKEAANMVLADDSYSTIVTAIKEGRTVYENLKKFVHYIFSCNIAELITVFAAIILGLPAPLSAVLILCIDLGTDVLPAVALGVDPSEPDIMNRKPRDPGKKIMDRPFTLRFVSLGLLMGAIVMCVYIFTLYRYGWQWGMPLAGDSQTFLKASSTAFALLIVIQMVNAFNSRSASNSIFKLGFFSNPFLLGAILSSVVLTFILVEVPEVQNYLHTTRLDLWDWALIIGSSLLVLFADEIRKIFVRRKLAAVAAR
jgi:potassium/sodium efflux P-type ATPase